MHGITEVTEEFYGSSSSKKPFNSLEKLEFAEMPEWKQWHVLRNGEFTTLQKLSIRNCPKLVGTLPENLCSLTKLRISECPKFRISECPELFTSQLQGMKQIHELYITDCNSLTYLPFSILPITLKSIRISRCQKLKLEASVGEMISSDYCNMFLEDLTLDGCDSIDDISPESIPRARTLTVERCHNLTRFLIPTGTETLDIRDCENLEILSVACGTQMTSFSIYNCKKLKRLPERMQELLPSLKELKLWNCPEIESFPEGGLPFNLQLLWINNCEKLVNCRKDWRLQGLPCLRELWIKHDGSDEEIVGDENWELPCSIQWLSIWNLKTLSSQVLKSFTSLEYLRIQYLPQIQSLLEEGLPSSLSVLTIESCPNLQSLAELALPSSLSKLSIKYCPNLQSLAELALPSSLSRLTIRECPNLQSLAELVLPSSLSQLTIESCPNLHSLAELALPSSLSTLSIHKCPLLEPLLEFDKGEYWPKIAHISTIGIDRECL